MRPRLPSNHLILRSALFLARVSKDATGAASAAMVRDSAGTLRQVFRGPRFLTMRVVDESKWPGAWPGHDEVSACRRRLLREAGGRDRLLEQGLHGGRDVLV